MLPTLSSVQGEKHSLVSQQVVTVDLSGTCCWVSTLTNTVILPLKLSNFAETASVKINDKKNGFQKQVSPQKIASDKMNTYIFKLFSSYFMEAC